MAIFISYSHENKKFVDKIAAHLIKHKARVWIDRWELNVGDSIIDKIQEAIQDSDALIIVVSKASMASQWCKKELSSGFLRELEEKRIIVLPVLIEDSDMPVFLRGKKYADFRKDFDGGISQTLEAVAKVTSDTQGRISRKDIYTDWSMDWGFTNNDLFMLRFTFVDHGSQVPYVVLTEIQVIANKFATERYKKHASNGREWLGRYPIILMMGEFAEENNNLQVIIEDSFPKKTNFTLQDSKLGASYDVFVTSRRLGEDTGKDVLIDFGNHLIMVKEQMKKAVMGFPKSKNEF